MYVSSSSLNTTLEWFCHSNYEFLILYAGGSTKFDYEMQDEFIKYRHLINQQTGSLGCFFHFVENSTCDIENKILPDFTHRRSLLSFFRINSREADLLYSHLEPGAGIAATYDTTDEICGFFQVARYMLPAVILVYKSNYGSSIEFLREHYEVIQISNKEDFYSLLELIKLVNELLIDSAHTPIVKNNKIKDIYISKLKKTLGVDEASILVNEILTKRTDFHPLFLNAVKALFERKIHLNTYGSSIGDKITKYGYDIFISCKSEDYSLGEEVHDFLKVNGYHPFIASRSLREIGESKYGSVISEVIDKCKHMIVVASNNQYLTAPYVKSEWELFCNEVKAGRNNGNLVSILVDPKVDVSSLPIDIRNSQILSIEDYKRDLCRYLY